MSWLNDHLVAQQPEVAEALKENFYYLGEVAVVEALVCTCETCQKGKLSSKKYGKIPLPSSSKLIPWEVVHVDLIGPWDIHYNSSSAPRNKPLKRF
jgi:hypothetical protein